MYPYKIATNIHVVADADLSFLHVKSRGTDLTVQGVMAFDAKNDLVVLEVSGEGVQLTLGNSDTLNLSSTYLTKSCVPLTLFCYSLL